MYQPVRNGKPIVKVSGVEMTYGNDGLEVNGHRCTKRETLAIANLLIPDYAAIVQAAREEQRQEEARALQKKSENTSAMNLKKQQHKSDTQPKATRQSKEKMV